MPDILCLLSPCSYSYGKKKKKLIDELLWNAKNYNIAVIDINGINWDQSILNVFTKIFLKELTVYLGRE